MKENTMYGIGIASILLCCFISCAKNKNDAKPDPVTELQYDQSDDIFPNPERGFMHMYAVQSEGEGLNLSQLKTLKNKNVTLIQRIYYFEKFKSKPLNTAELALIQADMQKVR